MGQRSEMSPERGYSGSSVRTSIIYQLPSLLRRSAAV